MSVIIFCLFVIILCLFVILVHVFFLFRSQTLFSNSMKDLQVTVNASLWYFEVPIDLEFELNRNYIIYSSLFFSAFTVCFFHLQSVFFSFTVCFFRATLRTSGQATSKSTCAFIWRILSCQLFL